MIAQGHRRDGARKGGYEQPYKHYDKNKVEKLDPFTRQERKQKSEDKIRRKVLKHERKDYMRGASKAERRSVKHWLDVSRFHY